MIDAHCHLAHERMNPEKAIANAKKIGLKAIINCGYPRDCENAMEITKKNRGFVYLALGLHPVDIAKLDDEEINEYMDFIKERRKEIVAIGEIGLDYHWFPEKNSEEGKRFREFFIRCLELAKELNLPIILHTRKAEQDCFDIVMEQGIEKAVFHCYSGNLTLVRQIADSGFYISLATNLLRSKNTKKIAKSFPLNRILTETDSPFLSPVPGKKNEPANVKMVVEKIAELRGMGFEEVAEQTAKNAERFFGLC